MIDILEIGYTLWIIIGTASYLLFFTDGKCAFDYYGLVTKYVYENTKMNIVGCVIVSILYYIAFPIFILRSIGMFFYWVLHIGRKN